MTVWFATQGRILLLQWLWITQQKLNLNYSADYFLKHICNSHWLQKYFFADSNTENKHECQKKYNTTNILRIETRLSCETVIVMQWET